MKFFVLSLFMSLGLLQATAVTIHFITDDNYRRDVERAYKQKVKLVGKDFVQPLSRISNPREREALQFLYAYMPIADVTDYPAEFFHRNVACSFAAAEALPWGQSVPELLFRHFVLPLRVNNEALDSARLVFYRELKPRVEHLSMKEAILEVNHWCHEHVTYQPSDARTLSPLACMKTAIGRCGEESTFTVAALRAVGIPARQVYTPRWAHTDDNHAWVEAWADGQWYFLGACEPEPVLNLGWFNAPASRAMLMHTRAFGDYRGPEEVVLRSSNFTEINLIQNYARNARTNFKVEDATSRPVSDARIDFMIYNYGEFHTVVTKYSDASGRSYLSAGLGDMLVWASKDGAYGLSKVSFGRDTLVTLRLSHHAETDLATSSWPLDTLLITPPAEHARMPQVSAEQRALNNLRLQREDSLRKAYEATFITPAKASAYPEALRPYLIASRGNWATLLAFYNRHPDNTERVLALLATLSQKDLRDMTMDILEDNFLSSSGQLCPRVESEMIIAPFKIPITQLPVAKRQADFKAQPTLLAEWIKKNIHLNPDTKSLDIAQTPMGALRSGLTDRRSRDILFVDMARSLGIEARKDAVTSKVQYRQNGTWHDVTFDAERPAATATGTLVLNYAPTRLLDDPKYYYHFTISKIVNGVPALLNYDEAPSQPGQESTWSNTFKQGQKLDVGTYLLTSGTRLANGSVLAACRFFNIKENETTTLELHMRQNPDEVSVIGNFDSESKFLKDGREVSLLSQTGRGYFVIGLVGMGQEPTNHSLRDLSKAAAEMDRWGRPIVLLFADERQLQQFMTEDFGPMPKNLICGIDKDGAIGKQIATRMKLPDAHRLPIYLIADTFNRVVFCSQGYTIGLGEQLQKVVTKLQED